MKHLKEEASQGIWRDDIIDSMATAIFVSAYADMIDQYCEDNGCSYNDLPSSIPYAGPGEDWMDNHPPVSEEAKEEARQLASQYEKENGKSLDALLKDAARADKISVDEIDFEYASDFGHYLGMMSLGHGVSWFDDHEEFPLHSPRVEFILDPEDVGLDDDMDDEDEVDFEDEEEDFEDEEEDFEDEDDEDSTYE